MLISMGLGTSPQSESVLKHIETLYCGVVPYKIIWARRLSGPRGSVHSGHGPARHFPAHGEHLPRVGHHNIYPDDAPARRGGPGRHQEPAADPGPSHATPKNRACPWTLGHKHSSSLYSNILTKSLEMENTMYRLTISLRVLSPASSIPLSNIRYVIFYDENMAAPC